MPAGASGTIIEIRGKRHHSDSPVEKHAGPTKRYVAGHKDHHDRGHRIEHRLPHMGLVTGARVRVVRNPSTGPVILALGETRIGLARGVASKVMVRPDPDEG